MSDDKGARYKEHSQLHFNCYFVLIEVIPHKDSMRVRVNHGVTFLYSFKQRSDGYELDGIIGLMSLMMTGHTPAQ